MSVFVFSCPAILYMVLGWGSQPFPSYDPNITDVRQKFPYLDPAPPGPGVAPTSFIQNMIALPQ